MYRSAIVIVATLTASTCLAQLEVRPRIIHNIENPEMVINDRGSRLEVLPTKRAIPVMTKQGVKAYDVAAEDASAPISQKHLGVVFNHAMQVQGYTTGEIVFKLKDDLLPKGFDQNSYPGFAKLTNPNVYLVVARTPLEFVELTKRLQERSDLVWVEPMVIYGQSEKGYSHSIH